MADKAYIVHSFARFVNQRCFIYLIGRLENGATFGFVDDTFLPFFYIRESDRSRAGLLIKQNGLRFENSGRFCMDGEVALLLRHSDKKHLKSVAEKLRQIGVRTYEADLRPEQQYLIDKKLRSTCLISGDWRPGSGVDRLYKRADLKVASAQINLKTVILETFFADEELQAFSLLVLPDQETNRPRVLGDYRDLPEREMLEQLRSLLLQYDPDILCGWKTQDWHLLPLQKRFKAHGIDFNLGRSRSGQWFAQRQFRGRELVVVQGRQILDTEELMSHTWERYSESTPESIIKAVLDEEVPQAGKENCKRRGLLLTRLLRRKNLIELSLRRSLLTGLNLERCWGSIASFEYLYMQELHKQKIVAPTLGIDRQLTGGSPGGLVFEPMAGLHKNIFVFDFKSLYPSIIRTFNIDPLAFERGKTLDEKAITVPLGIKFDREEAILSDILKRFFESREQAKLAGDDLASFVCKILMNSFFGVLGTSGCRFAQGSLVASVSTSGHYLLRWVREFLHEKGYRVLYGDTDSLFVDLGFEEELTYADAQIEGSKVQKLLNDSLADHLDKDFGVISRLDLEFEKYYRDFFQPSMRAGEGGRAKSYAAIKATANGDDLELVGLEAVRRDWTVLAQQLQRDLLMKVFEKRPFLEIEEFVQNIIKELNSGHLDHQLTYRKKLSKSLDSYIKTTPPHVKAARLLDKVPRVIFYVMTHDGPQPIEKLTAEIDYQHYIEKQIAPIVKSLAQHYPFSFDKAISPQGRLW